ncbi:MAG TPA: TolC family protein [Candidatus Binatia bacterium]|nr:TolC family protein [Candidatus Binatia bacterium]
MNFSMHDLSSFAALRRSRLVICAILLCLATTSPAQPFRSATNQTGTNVFLIDLPTVLRLAGAQNLDVRLAEQKLVEAKAHNESATLKFFPWLNAGVAYNRHDGRIQDTGGQILDVSKQSYSPGAALTAQWDFGGAIYQKLAARQLQHAAAHALNARQQDTIAAAAQGYFDLAFVQAAIGVAREAVRISTNYEAQVRSAVAAGIAFKGDLLRVSVEAERNRMALQQAIEVQRVAAARLAQILHLDPAVELEARDADLIPIALVETNATLGLLLNQAIAMRPELKQSQALAKAAKENKNGAVYGPLIPTLTAQAFGGGLGGGPDDSWGNFGDQENYFVGASWRIGPGGLFDFGRSHAAKAQLNSARIETSKIHDEIICQVVATFARLQSQSAQIGMAKQALTEAQKGWRLAEERKEFGVGIVLENIQAEQDLTRARDDYFKTVAEFNKAQYELSQAVGSLPASK